jgi:hypothetical protein
MAGVAEKRRPPTSLVGAILMRDMFMQERALGMARVTADKGLRWKSNRGQGGDVAAPCGSVARGQRPGGR